MRPGALVSLAVLALCASTAAAQEAPAVAPSPPPPVEAPAPSKGPLLLILAGSGLGVGGAVNLGLAPLCVTSKVAAPAHGACLGMSLAFGVGLLGAGVPLLVYGVRQREAQRIGLAPVVGGAALTWGRSW